MSFSCNKVNSIVISTINGQGYFAKELNRAGKTIEQISGKTDDPRMVIAFFERMGYPIKKICCNAKPATDFFSKSKV